MLQRQQHDGESFVQHGGGPVPRRVDARRDMRSRSYRAGASAQRVDLARATRALRDVHAASHRRARHATMNAYGAPTIEVRFPDIDRWARGNVGVPYVWSFDAARP